MHMSRSKIIVFCLLIVSSTLFSQSITLTQPFTELDNTTVLDQYQEQFGNWEKPDLDDTFPYVVIRVGLDGTDHDITMARQMLGLYMGTQTAVEAIDRSADDELLFLIPKRARRVEISCGDGCARLTILDGAKSMKSNRIYYGRIHYVPLSDDMRSTTLARQKFQVLVSPKDAIVEVFIDGKKELWPVMNGVASKMLNQGSYRYRVSANRYYPEEGNFVVLPQTGELQVTLRPQFGWVTIDGDTQIYGAYVFATNTSTGSTLQLGTIPIDRAELSAGKYSLMIQMDKYKDYSTTISIEEALTTEVRPIMEPNYSMVTLSTSESSDIYIDGHRMGKGVWKGTLEYGEYVVETRQQSHKSAYTSIVIAPGDVNVAYTLNNPIPMYGTLIIDGKPIDANIWIDNQLKGTTPMVFNQILVGEHQLRIAKNGYSVNKQIITINQGEDASVSYDLMKIAGGKNVNASLADGIANGNMHVFTVAGVTFAMAKVNGGTFIMGATEEQEDDMNNDEIPIHQVSISDFYMGQTEVTQELWMAVMGNNPSAFSSNLSNPVENVSWEDCQLFIKKLNNLTGQTFRLPTEAEWEYAARGGRDTINYKFSGDSIASNVAWSAENSGASTHLVAMKAPNQLELYDMSGNVCEWCQDWYSEYDMSKQNNPHGPESGAYKVYRGGSWYFDARYARVAQRNYHTTTFSNYNIGFRLALSHIEDEKTSDAQEIELQPIELLIMDSTNMINVKGVSFSMINIEGGDFMMGATQEQGNDAKGGEKPIRKITLSNFAMAQTEVTQALWQAIMGTNPSADTTHLLNPVTNITWDECHIFISKLNEMTGRRFRLPTEAEWEYAARGGQKSEKFKYAGGAIINDLAWYNANSEGHIHPIGQKQPNELGLYDMSGNVSEWCHDWFGTYEGEELYNPLGPAKGSYRVVRGGSANTAIHTQRVSYRNGYAMTDKFSDLGFRLVEDIESPTENTDKKINIPMHESTLRFDVKGVTFTMVKVESGSFVMGATDEHGELAYNWEKPVHYVTVADFFIGQTEVTQELWNAVMGYVPSKFQNDPTNPVENVSWEDCQTFITRLSAITGVPFRLPTEAEWEYAARGGKHNKRLIYAGSANVDDVTWYKGNSLGTSHPVGLKRPNELGLYDMGGNVWEWCADWYGQYEANTQINPTGPESSTTNRRVIRGGSWILDATNCRVTMRTGQLLSDRKVDIGFRLAL